MSHKNTNYLIGIYVTMLLMGCNHYQHRHELRWIDSLITTRPDSALSLLESLSDDTISWLKADRMYYRLLHVAAKDKNDLPIGNSSDMEVWLSFYEHDGDKRILPLAYYYAGRIYYEKNDYPTALKYYMLAEESNSTNNKLMTRIYSQTGYLYTEQNIYSKALEYHRKEVECSIATGDTVAWIYGLRDLAQVHNTLGQLDSCRLLLLQAKDLCILSHHSALLSGVMGVLASVYSNQGENARARECLQYTLGHIQKNDKMGVYQIASKVFLRCGEYDSARYYIEEILRTGNVKARRIAHKRMAQICIEEDKTSDALQHLLACEQCDDSIQATTERDAISKAEALYQYHLKEMESRKLELDKQKMMTIAIISICILVVVLLVFLFYYYNNKRKQKEQEMRYKSLLQKLGKEDRAEVEHNNAKEVLIRQSKIYKYIIHIINSPDESLHLNESHWKEIESEINTVYGNFTERLLFVCKMRKQAFRICLLMKLGIPTTGISKLVCCTNQAVSNTKKRLSERVFGKDGNAKTWDEYIKKN